jgi:acyl phosphate:glycerol-3-phosphate acyltransferase
LAGVAQSVVAWTALAYFVGAVPMGVLLARAKGIDLRKVGSGNIGATNAARALGGKLGLVVFVLDALKAALPVWLASRSWALGDGADAQLGLSLVAFAAVLGHIFPIYLGFRGGKGVACAFGVFLALDPPVAAAALLMYAQGLWLTRTSAVGSLTAVTSITVCVVLAQRPGPEQLLALAVAALIWVRHIGNVRRVIADAKARKRAAAQAQRS